MALEGQVKVSDNNKHGDGGGGHNIVLNLLMEAAFVDGGGLWGD